MDSRRPTIVSASELVHPQLPRDADDFGVDFSEMMALLWSRRLWIAACCVIGAALGLAWSAIRPPNYVGTARLNVQQASGVPAAADAAANFQVLVRNSSVVRSALRVSGVSEDEVQDVVANIESRYDRVVGQLVVDVTHSDAAAAGTLAPAVARAAVASFSEQQNQLNEAMLTLQRQELELADRRFAEAQSQMAEFRRDNRGELGRVDLDALSARQREMAELLAEIPTERARLAVARQRLESTPQTVRHQVPDPVPALTLEIASERARLDALRKRLAGIPETIRLQTAMREGPVDAAVGSQATRVETFNPTYVTVLGMVATSEARLASLEARRAGLADPKMLAGVTAVIITDDQGLGDDGRRASPSFVNPGYTEVLRQVATSEAQLAGLEARRDYLATLEVADARNTLARNVSQLEVRQNQLQSELTRAQQLRDRLSDNYLQSRMSARAGVRIDLIDEPPTAGVPAGPRTAGSMARGFAFGLIGSAAVFLLYGRPGAARRRYPEMA